MKTSIFVDTSAWYALVDKNDRSYEAANRFHESNTFPFVTTNSIIHESLTLIKKRLGHSKAIEVGNSLWNQEIATIIAVAPEDEAVAWKIFQHYDDKGFSFIDCLTFAVMERFKIPAAFAFDDHFKQYGKFKCLP